MLSHSMRKMVSQPISLCFSPPRRLSLLRVSWQSHWAPWELCWSCRCQSGWAQQVSDRLIIHSLIVRRQHGGTARPLLWLFCASTPLSLPRQLPPRLLASTRARYVRLFIPPALAFFLFISRLSSLTPWWVTKSSLCLLVSFGGVLYHRWS